VWAAPPESLSVPDPPARRSLPLCLLPLPLARRPFAHLRTRLGHITFHSLPLVGCNVRGAALLLLALAWLLLYPADGQVARHTTHHPPPHPTPHTPHPPAVLTARGTHSIAH
jgi:hypothetical protein